RRGRDQQADQHGDHQLDQAEARLPALRVGIGDRSVHIAATVTTRRWLLPSRPATPPAPRLSSHCTVIVQVAPSMVLATQLTPPQVLVSVAALAALTMEAFRD